MRGMYAVICSRHIEMHCGDSEFKIKIMRTTVVSLMSDSTPYAPSDSIHIIFTLLHQDKQGL